ncbi:M48 family metallopeptidase [bacterium]|nr:M48 family metallopeptidase [bacterium]
MTEEFKIKAERYERIRNIFFLSDQIFLLLFLALLLFGGGNCLSLRCWGWVQNVCKANFWLSTALFVLIFEAAYLLFSLPYEYLKDYRVELKFDLTNQTAFGWLLDFVKSSLLSVLLLLAAFLFCYASMRYFGKLWFLAAGAGWIVLQIVLGMLFPVLILPLFYKSEELKEHPCKEELLKLIDKAGLKITGLYRLDMSEKTKKANAMLCGLGATRRVMLSDALLEYPPEEIVAIMAHEIGHYKGRHIWKLAALHTALILLGLFLISQVLWWYCGKFGLDFYEAGTLPVFVAAFSLWQLVVMPVTNGFSRKCESEADAFALRHADNLAFASALRRLAEENLAVMEVSRLVEIFLYSHPAIGKRIGMAENWKGNL